MRVEVEHGVPFWRAMAGFTLCSVVCHHA